MAARARKRKAEDSVNDKLTAMAATIEQLMAIQREMAESQKAFLESNKMIPDRNKELTEMIKTQGEEIKALRALIQDNTSQRTYSEVAASDGTSMGSQTSGSRPSSVSCFESSIADTARNSSTPTESRVQCQNRRFSFDEPTHQV
jgi:hypothetical protein